MSAHLTDRRLADFRRGTLAAGEILALDAHLADCADCRARAARGLLPGDGGIGASDDRHLDDEQLADYADGVSTCRDDVERHLAICEECTATVADLRELRHAIAPVTPRRRWLWPAIAAAAVLVIGVALARGPGGRKGEPPPSLAAHEEHIRDGSATVAIANNTVASGLERLSAEERATIAGALANGRLPVPENLSRVGSEPGRLMGAPASGSGFAPLSPVATAVLSQQPRVRWSALPGARGYIVTIVDEQLRTVAESPVVDDTAWQPASPLPRGGVYLWQVRARLSHGSQTAPAPPEPEARFLVLDDHDAAEVSSLRARAGDSRLAGILLARFGLMEDAARELATAAAENPSVAVLPRLAQAATGARPAPSTDRR